MKIYQWIDLFPNFINKQEFEFKLRSNSKNMIFIWDQKRLKDQILELILQRNMKKKLRLYYYFLIKISKKYNLHILTNIVEK